LIKIGLENNIDIISKNWFILSLLNALNTIPYSLIKKYFIFDHFKNKIDSNNSVNIKNAINISEIDVNDSEYDSDDENNESDDEINLNHNFDINKLNDDLFNN
jgi:hypothetical protein